MEKKCYGPCKQIKNESEFYGNAKKGYCKDCQRTYNREWSRNHKEEIKKNRNVDKEKQSEYYKKWYENNRKGKDRRDIIVVVLNTNKINNIKNKMKLLAKKVITNKPDVCYLCDKRSGKINGYKKNYKNIFLVCSTCSGELTST